MNKLTKELLKKNNSADKAVFHENQEIYTNMIVYLRGSDLAVYNQEVVRGDIIDLIIDGQQRGDDIQKVMGGRYKEICDEIVDAMPLKTKKDKAMEFIDMSLNVLWVLGLIAIINDLITSLTSEATGFNFILTVGDIISLISIVVIANAIVWHITKTTFKKKKDKKIVAFLKTWLICMLIFAATILSSILFRTIVVSIPLWIAAIIVLFIFVIWKIASDRI